ncbi:MAG TPA: glutamine amidotransferase [Candidatus Saccharibacteria bacterium]|nr:glutamine amidotransferase [Candidatus Saccharibacteria bacterium]HRK93911.1 glutamine amidotransferase [Candidatus Saccharibacteria bacterium]
MKNELHILQLYPRDMNIYGDWGNVLTVMRRAEWHGFTPVLHEYNPGDAFPEYIDIVIGGGGQDAGQDVIQTDLLKISPKLHELANSDTPMLLICGLYQLFGRFFKTKDGHEIKGIGIFDLETHGGPERMIGNIVTSSDEFGEIIGYENHSGQTFLGESAISLGKVIKGAGNNGQDEYEGARYRHVIGSYLHGSLLPKNPVMADWLIEKAAIKKFGEFTPQQIDDRLALAARKVALSRPR